MKSRIYQRSNRLSSSNLQDQLPSQPDFPKCESQSGTSSLSVESVTVSEESCNLLKPSRESANLRESTDEMVNNSMQQSGLLKESFNNSSVPPTASFINMKKPISYVTDANGKPVFELITKRRKRQVVIRVHDPAVDLDELNNYLIAQLRKYEQSKLDVKLF